MGNLVTNAAETAATLPLPLLVNVSAAAKLLGLGTSTVWQLVSTGKIRATKIGRRTLIVRSEIERIAADGC